jgi:hypothetical protein
MGLKTTCIVLLLISAGVAQARADYLIIADPLAYTIYNQYQQPLSSSEKAEFAPCSPLRVIEKSITLGDQITRALKFEFGRQVYFLLMDEDGKFTGEKPKSGRQSVKNSETIGDTVEATAGGLNFSAGSGRTAGIPKGTRIYRVFRSDVRYYIAVLQDRVTYGWSSLEPRSAWRKISKGTAPETATVDTVLSETVKERIKERLASANESYKSIFSHFNSLTGDEKAMPRWRCESSGSRMRCALTGSGCSSDQLSESTRFLAQDMENLLIGTDFGVYCRNGEIVIEKRR